MSGLIVSALVAAHMLGAGATGLRVSAPEQTQSTFATRSDALAPRVRSSAGHAGATSIGTQTARPKNHKTLGTVLGAVAGGLGGAILGAELGGRQGNDGDIKGFAIGLPAGAFLGGWLGRHLFGR